MSAVLGQGSTLLAVAHVPLSWAAHATAGLRPRLLAGGLLLEALAAVAVTNDLRTAVAILSLARSLWPGRTGGHPRSLTSTGQQEDPDVRQA